VIYIYTGKTVKASNYKQPKKARDASAVKAKNLDQ
jgi:hypothetical protein